MNKEQLLSELSELGIHPSGRKVRSDKGCGRLPQVNPRKDKGKKRSSYNTSSAAFAKKKFFDLLRAYTDQDAGEGDSLTRDQNGIFPPTITHVYRTITKAAKNKTDPKTGEVIYVPERKYSSRVKKQIQPEYLRWKWWFREYAEAKGSDELYWQNKIATHYHLHPNELLEWTYHEWAWAYVNNPDQAILLYTESEVPPFDEKGDIIWPTH